MITSAIICEFNPFHRGHERLFRFARAKGADRILCIMSGNFVQRGEPAIADKYTRAKAAILAGADLVLELPVPFSSSSAEYFARAGVWIADRLGFVDELVFGSETGDATELEKIAERQLSTDFFERISRIYTGELGFAISAQRAYEELYGKNDALSSPNNILAIEYLKSLKRLGSRINIRTISREDNYSRQELDACSEYPSATALRRLIFSGELEKTADQMPSAAYASLLYAESEGLFPIDMNKYGFAMLSAMRLANAETLSEIEGVSAGLENRIVQSALEASSYTELLAKLATKKYTDARLRRALLFSLLGITHSDMSLKPRYINLLAANSNGRELLSSLRKNDNITVVTKVADKKQLMSSLDLIEKADAERLLEIEKRADSLYSLCLPRTRDAGYFGRMSPFIEK